MNSYRSHIVDILVENICLSKSALFLHRGIKNKKEFTRDLKQLLAEERIRYEDGIRGELVLSPKVLKLEEYENRCGAHTRTFIINYVPTAVLEKVLEYVNPGNDPFEDNLDFELDIEAYKLEEKYKAFFEEEMALY